MFKKKVSSYLHTDTRTSAVVLEVLNGSITRFQRSQESKGFSSGFHGRCEASVHLASMNVHFVSIVLGGGVRNDRMKIRGRGHANRCTLLR